jgi:type IV pilus assembly protein PilM
MKRMLQKFLPKKNHFVGIDIGTSDIKLAEIKIIDGFPEVVALRNQPCPPGVWTDIIDEESLVQALREIACLDLKEAITCIGGEKVVSRIVRLPRMNDKEMESAAVFEIQKFMPTLVDQLIIRHVILNGADSGPSRPAFVLRKKKEPEVNGSQGEGQDVLLLAVPAATVYQYYSIFSRAGMVVTAADLQAFALWRVFGRTLQGTVAIADIGAKTSQLVLVKEGMIKFVRLLPTGVDILTDLIMNALGVSVTEAQNILRDSDLSAIEGRDEPEYLQEGDDLLIGSFQQMQVEAAAALDKEPVNRESAGLISVLHEGLAEIIKELRRSLSYYSNQESIQIEKLILSGGICKLKGLTGHLEEALGLPVEVGVPEIEFSQDTTYSPEFAVSIGLALREVTG